MLLCRTSLSLPFPSSNPSRVNSANYMKMNVSLISSLFPAALTVTSLSLVTSIVLSTLLIRTVMLTTNSNLTSIKRLSSNPFLLNISKIWVLTMISQERFLKLLILLLTILLLFLVLTVCISIVLQLPVLDSNQNK